jgi:hypothetical protein
MVLESKLAMAPLCFGRSSRSFRNDRTSRACDGPATIALMPKPQASRKLGRNEPLKGERLARIKKQNPRRGLKLGTYSAVWKGKRYEWNQGTGWKKVPLGFANYLATLPSTQGVNPGGEGDEDAPRGFWIARTIAEAEAIDERERKAEEKANKPREAMSVGDLAVSDLRAQSRFDDDENDDEEEEDEEEPPKVDAEDDEDDEELRDLNLRMKELEEHRVRIKKRKADEAKAPATSERSMRAPKEEERTDAADENEEQDDDEEDESEDDDADPDLNNGKPADVDFDKDVKPAATSAKSAPAKPAAKKAAQKKKGRGKNR